METIKLQKLFLISGFVFAIFAAILSFFQDTYSRCVGGSYDTGGGCGGGIDIAADGGAAGFAILAGLCFIAVAIMTLKNQDSQSYGIGLTACLVKDYIYIIEVY